LMVLKQLLLLAGNKITPLVELELVTLISYSMVTMNSRWE
jgi:hypothetical protein